MVDGNSLAPKHSDRKEIAFFLCHGTW